MQALNPKSRFPKLREMNIFAKRFRVTGSWAGVRRGLKISYELKVRRDRSFGLRKVKGVFKG